MSLIDEKEIIESEDEAEQGENTDDGMKLVPVAESIRYRKRAQSAEKKAEILAQQLAEAKTQAAKMGEQLNDIQVEQKLMRKLAACGTVDMEAAMLIAKARVEATDDADLDSVVKQLRKEKQYLFGGNIGGSVTSKKTAGAKDRIQNSQTIIERAAKKAARTGNRADLQEYLKLRRNFR